MKITEKLFVRSAEMLCFGAVVGFLLLMGEVIDEVRHGHENLMIGFVIPLWGFAALFSTFVSRAVQMMVSPILSPERLLPERSNWSVIATVVLALMVGIIWGKSPLFAQIYDSCKIILTLQIAGFLWGILYKSGGLRNVLISCVVALVAAIAACGGLLFIVHLMSSGGSSNTVEIARALTSIGVPLAILLALFDCLCQTQISTIDVTSP